MATPRPALSISASTTGRNAETPITVIVGAIFKHQPEFHGRPHEWVAPSAAVQAIAVMEAPATRESKHGQAN
jgi:hypothetical protein